MLVTAMVVCAVLALDVLIYMMLKLLAGKLKDELWRRRLEKLANSGLMTVEMMILTVILVVIMLHSM